jgi:Transposase, Mutator family
MSPNDCSDDVVRIFPNAASCLRLIRALAVEMHENWLNQSAPWTTLAHCRPGPPPQTMINLEKILGTTVIDGPNSRPVPSSHACRRGCIYR